MRVLSRKRGSNLAGIRDKCSDAADRCCRLALLELHLRPSGNTLLRAAAPRDARPPAGHEPRNGVCSSGSHSALSAEKDNSQAGKASAVMQERVATDGAAWRLLTREASVWARYRA
jgi:hypothetical protein